MEQLPSAPREAELPLSAITRQEALQVRELQQFGKLQVRPDIVEDYRQLYEEDRDLGLLTVVEEVEDDGEKTGRYLLADGYHRSEARFRPALQYRVDLMAHQVLQAEDHIQAHEHHAQHAPRDHQLMLPLPLIVPTPSLGDAGRNVRRRPL